MSLKLPILSSPAGFVLFTTSYRMRCRKAHVIMKLSAFLLVVTNLQLFAIGYGQKVSVTLKNASLEQVLSEIQRQTAYTFIYNAALSERIKRQDLEFIDASIEQILDFCLRGQNISYHFTDHVISLKQEPTPSAKEELPIDIKGLVTDAENGSPLAGVSIIVKGTSKGTTTDSEGKYVLDGLNPTNVLVFSFVGFETREILVGENTNINVALKISIQSLSEIVVSAVGSRSTVVRSNTSTLAPVDIVTSKDLLTTGQLEITQMLNAVAPSFTTAKTTIADGVDHIDPSSLRGMQPDQVLVLVNGKRRYSAALVNINNAIGRGSVATDMNSIAPASIERIEILRDGASSQYGSDAIAGIINIVLKKKTGTTVVFNSGQYRTDFLNRSVADGLAFQLSANHGMNLGKKGTISFSLELRKRDSTNRSGDYTGTVYTNNVAQDEILIAQNGFSRRNNMHVGQSKNNTAIFSVNGEVPVSAHANIYFTGSMGYRDGLSGGFYRYPRQTSQVIAQLYPNGFLPRIFATILDRSLTAGIKGETKNNWNWDFSHTYGFNSFRFDVRNSNNASQYALGADAPTRFYAGTVAINQNVTDVVFSKDFASQVSLKSFNVALGSELRFDNFQQMQGEEASWKNYDIASGKVGGSQVFPGYQPSNEVNKTRSVIAAFVDLESDMTDRLLMGAAGRFENYSDFGNVFAGKFSLRYKFSEFFSVRGTVSNGFRAPAMQQYYFSSVVTLFTPTGPGGSLVPTQTGTFNNESSVTRAFGIAPLKAEKSVSFSAGITSKISKDVSLTVDAYQINVKDRILYTSSFPNSNATVAAILAPFPDVGAAQFFTNSIDTQTNGMDVVITATPSLGKGKFNASLAANFNRTSIEGGIRGLESNTNGAFDRYILDRRDSGRIVVGYPRDKYVFNLGYSIGKFSTNLRAIRYGEVRGLNSANPAFDEYLSPKIVTDFSVSYNIIKSLQLTLGANNVFDVYPDEQKFDANKNSGRYVYSVIATQFNYFGRYVFATLTARF